LAAIGLAEHEAGDFGDAIPLVGGFERAGEEVVFFDGLRSEPGIDASAAEEEQLFDGVTVGAVDDVVLDLEVVEEKLGGLVVVGVDAADFGRGEEDVFRLFAGVELLDGGGIAEVQFGVGAANEVGKAEALERAPEGAAQQSAVAGDLGAGVRVEFRHVGKRAGKGRETRRQRRRQRRMRTNKH